jgi:hypothetical protein
MNTTHLTRRLALFSAGALLALSAPAGADVILDEDFEDFDASGWTANGVVTIYEGNGNPGNYLVLPYGDFFGVSLSAREPASMVLGDLTAVGPLRLSVDIQVFQARTFGEDDLDMSQWPMVFELVDYGDPENGIPFSTVYTIQGTWPDQLAGWATFSFELPDPTSKTLPAGWGGTGDSDPVTGEPVLPPGVTYRDVLSSVDEVRVTTFVPGFFYTFNFWEVGFDNIVVETIGGKPCRADFNGDDTVNSQDFFDFLTAFFASEPAADFNEDTVVNSQDFFDFLTAFFAGC